MKNLPKINILTRTSKRPKGFKRHIENIRGQTYKNISHIVSSDDPETAKYVEENSHPNMLHVRINREDVIKNDNSPKYNTGKYFPANLYLNILMGS